MDNKDSLKELLNKTTFTKKQKTVIVASFCIAIAICAYLLIVGAILVAYDHFIASACCWGVATAVVIVLCIAIKCIKKGSVSIAPNNDNTTLSNEVYITSFVKAVNSYIEILSKNETLQTIITNYAHIKPAHTFLLEYTFLPLKRITTLSNDIPTFVVVPCPEVAMDFDCSDSDYLKMMRNYNAQVLNIHHEYVKNAYYLRDNIFRDASQKIMFSASEDDRIDFSDINDLYKSLCNQGIINETSNRFSYYAFLFLIYKAHRQLMGEETIEQLNNYNLSIDDDEEHIIDVLHKNDVEDSFITVLVMNINGIKNGYCDFLNEEMQKAFLRVRNELDTIIEKEKIALLKQPNLIMNTTPQMRITDVDIMSGREFEYFVSQLFTQLGYKTKQTKASGDQGIDVIATKGTTVVAIQAKCYSKPVGNHAIMEAVAGSKYYKANKTIVVTNSVFTKSARELAIANGVVLWDRVVLKEKLDELNE